MSSSRTTSRLGPALLLGLLSTFSAILGADTPDGEVLTEETVVRLFVSGTPAGELIRRIGESEVRFDLEPEMVEELRAAGLPDELLRAMLERQAALTARDAPAAADGTAALPSPDPPGGPELTLRLNPGEDAGEKARPVIRLDEFISPDQLSGLGLGQDEVTFTDIAIVLACRTADHVPDHWRNQTPLGRDFRFTPRHRLLAFVPGAERREAGVVAGVTQAVTVTPGARKDRPDGMLVLEIPESLRVELEPEVAHDLLVGLAVQAGNRYYLVTSAERDGVVIDEGGLELTAELLGSGSTNNFTVRMPD